jgi:hypothetical protein
MEIAKCFVIKNSVKKARMKTTTDAEKAFDKIQHPFLTKALKKLGIERKFLNLILAIFDKTVVNIILNGEQLKTILLKLGMRWGFLLPPLLFNRLLESLARAIS